MPQRRAIAIPHIRPLISAIDGATARHVWRIVSCDTHAELLRDIAPNADAARAAAEQALVALFDNSRSGAKPCRRKKR